MNFLINDDFIDGMIIEKCTMRNNVFHQTTGGCVICKDENGHVFHLFKNINITMASDNKCLLDVLCFNNKYIKEKYFENDSGYRVFTEIKPNYKDLLRICKKGEQLRSFVKTHNQFYLDDIKPHLPNGFDLHPICMYDIVSINNKIVMLRPLNIIRNSRHFAIGQRTAFLYMLSLYAYSNEAKRAHEANKSSIKDRLVCTPSFFTQKRTIIPELECEYNASSQCAHISQNSKNGVTLLHVPKRLCKHLLNRMICDHTETVVADLLNFRCKLVADVKLNIQKNCMHDYDENNVHMREGNEDDEDFNDKAVPLVFIINYLYTRTTSVHRFCLPDVMIDDRFLKWFYDLIKVITKNTD